MMLPILVFVAARAAMAASYCVATAPDLQAALDAEAVDADEVGYVSIVAGTYFTDDNGGAPFTYSGTTAHAVYIQGGYGPGCGNGGPAATTILDGSHHTLVLQTHDVQGMVLVGHLTIQNGNGGGVAMNTAPGENGWAYVENSTIRANDGDYSVGLLAFTGNGGVVQLVNNLIEHNHATVARAGAAVFADNTSTAYIANNTVANNVNDDTSQPGGLFYQVAGGGAIINNVFWNNTSYGLVLNDPAVLTDNDYGSLGGTFSPGTGSSGNVSTNPHFMDESAENYRLSSASTLAGMGAGVGPGGIVFLDEDLDHHLPSSSGHIDPGAYQDTIFDNGYEAN